MELFSGAKCRLNVRGERFTHNGKQTGEKGREKKRKLFTFDRRVTRRSSVLLCSHLRNSKTEMRMRKEETQNDKN